MPPKLLADLDGLDLDRLEADIEEIRRYNPQRYEMEQLDGIIRYMPEEGLVIARKDVRPDEFWVRGHIPGRPLMPGVLICECAAQACSYYYKRVMQTDRFLGFGGMEEVKFRAPVLPGDRLIMIAKSVELKSRRAVFKTQGVVNGKLVFEGTIIGMPL